ncbi:MED7-domain-containing protein [Trichoderma citrinoviride]|uniref:Mediator of RNA polymerase II transcription subunit 7 n=1 Tax=Trichoderma citrinoviride TaxID=58853 RepID=A0A2T4B8I9_9HYPO|nr:MED7-domain-containing protein [Trichoderma citrinoviride]PTB65539.1 MED7-domain-containing protein [Trichoderma citrinoviride]
MDDQPEPHSLASTFPNPPEFWREFTPDRIAELNELRLSRASPDQDDGNIGRIPDLPEHLRHLQPPPEPADGRWRVFGDQYMLDDKLPTLEEQGIQNLPATASSSAKDAKHYDRAFELKRLVKSLLLNFLELNGVLARNPADAEAKILDIRTIFINIHHILNEYRPHQARESAIEMMQDHLDRTRTETAAIRTQVDKARKVLEGLGSLDLSLFQEQQLDGADRILDASPLTDMTAADMHRGERRERAAAAWCMADALLN